MREIELKSYGTSARGFSIRDGGKVVVNVNFENIPKVKISELEDMAYEFLDAASKVIEKEG